MILLCITEDGRYCHKTEDLDATMATVCTNGTSPHPLFFTASAKNDGVSKFPPTVDDYCDLSISWCYSLSMSFCGKYLMILYQSGFFFPLKRSDQCCSIQWTTQTYPFYQDSTALCPPSTFMQNTIDQLKISKFNSKGRKKLFFLWINTSRRKRNRSQIEHWTNFGIWYNESIILWTVFFPFLFFFSFFDNIKGTLYQKRKEMSEKLSSGYLLDV